MTRGFGRTGRVGPPTRHSLGWSLIRLLAIATSAGVQLRTAFTCLPYLQREYIGDGVAGIIVLEFPNGSRGGGDRQTLLPLESVGGVL
ncbi:uncharacterized protein F4807DRAFT_423428 [Annulohypoxylon truncatum]|uniref:uncharacterized protein n=1 Tax=Annulohypoxylon truncatum TaxID=327061 RepID=UPI0020079787|nr:uncharacterized protein F4807DRAFT_423428 [Annulohypoxylon truncatum]KAI1210442.1 hypothetical protein F4807DRAFT_423428 [Annulohypoxylon truncatum]